MSGQENSLPQQTGQLTAKDELAKWDKILDEYENKLGLPNIQAPGPETELQEYLTWDRKALEGLSAEDCAGISYRLKQFAFYLQRSQNREIARVNWATTTLKKCIDHTLNSYQGYSYDERAAQAIKENQHAASLKQIVIYAQQRIDRLNFLAKSIGDLAEYMKAIQYSKRDTHDGARTAK